VRDVVPDLQKADGDLELGDPAERAAHERGAAQRRGDAAQRARRRDEEEVVRGGGASEEQQRVPVREKRGIRACREGHHQLEGQRRAG